MRCDGVMSPVPTPLRAPGPHLSSRASWTDCSRLWAGTREGPEVSLPSCSCPCGLPPHSPAQLLLPQQRPLLFPLWGNQVREGGREAERQTGNVRGWRDGGRERRQTDRQMESEMVTGKRIGERDNKTKKLCKRDKRKERERRRESERETGMESLRLWGAKSGADDEDGETQRRWRVRQPRSHSD